MPLAPFETKDAYLVQQVNIYVTQVRTKRSALSHSQQMTRIVILQYRAELGLYKGPTLVPHPKTFEEERDEIVHLLLKVLEHIPLNIIGKFSAMI